MSKDIAPMEGFGEADYRNLLESLPKLGYAVRGFEDAEPSSKHVILRHDIDMSLDAAIRIAEIEAEYRVIGQYFVLLRADLYNLFQAENVKKLKTILSLGHKVNLHLDAGLYGDNWEDLDKGAHWECTALEQLTGQSVTFVSFHRPQPRLLNNPNNIAGRRHSYQPHFFKNMGYCSDSMGGWFHGHPLEHSAIKNGHALQLLTHPIWWAGEAASAEQRLRKLVENENRRYQICLANNCKTYRPILLAEKQNLDGYPHAQQYKNGETP